MKNLLNKIFGARIWALFLKELKQIRNDKRLIFTLIIPPTIQLIIFGYALNPEVTNLRLGVVDESRTAASREVISAFVESHSFRIKGYYLSTEDLGQSLSKGDLEAGLIIPVDFAKKRERGVTAQVQFLLDAVDYNTAGIAGGYAQRIIASLNQRIAQEASLPAPAQAETENAGGTQNAVSVNVVGNPKASREITARIALLYNSGLQNAWFIVTGTLGILLVLNGSLISSASMVKEKEIGTVEQLLMTPAQSTEIIVAKMAPLFLLLLIDIFLALAVGSFFFSVPIRGNIVLLCFAGALCVLAGIGIGTIIATFSKSQQQAQLISFFVNPPLALLAGATTPIEAIPDWLRPLTWLNPIRHFASIARGVMLKGVGIEELYPYLLSLVGFAAVLITVSALRFRKQLG
jgi:ABC-2 type transport system permease protein